MGIDKVLSAVVAVDNVGAGEIVDDTDERDIGGGGGGGIGISIDGVFVSCG
jgi:hypothetical protein